MFLMIIIVVVVTIFTAGAAAPLLGVTAGAGAGTFATGLAVLGGTATGSALAIAGAAAIGGAVGSIAGQAFGIMTGLQDSFSWKNVALSAVGAGVTAGIGASGILNVSSSTAVQAGINAAVSNVATQGLSIAAGQQQKFNWKGVAAAGVGAAVSTSISNWIGKMQYPGTDGGVSWANTNPNTYQSDWGKTLVRGIGANVGSDVVQQLISSGKVDWRAVAGSAASVVINQAIKTYAPVGLNNIVGSALGGAALSAINHRSIAGGAIGGATGSIIGQLAPSAIEALDVTIRRNGATDIRRNGATLTWPI
jgi:hypothetical protein